MPPGQPPRPGFEHLKQQGKEWQDKTVFDLCEAFGQEYIIGELESAGAGRLTYGKVDLIDYLPKAFSGAFIVEAEFDVGDTFEKALGIPEYRRIYNLSYARLRPDLLQVLPAKTFREFISAEGATHRVSDYDHRLQLRIIEVKLTAEPSPSHFAEATYYSMALAGWLVDQGLSHLYVVVSDAAIFPGSHDASNVIKTSRESKKQLQTPTYEQLQLALTNDLEIVPFEVFASSVKTFLCEIIPAVLSTSWEDLPWHVDNRCTGCDYVGYLNWVDRNGQRTYSPQHCIPNAEYIDHLSRIADVSRGMRRALESQGIFSVFSLASLSPQDDTFNSHHYLRARKYVMAERASSFQKQQAYISPFSGSSAVMPRWANLHIYLTIDFDVGSAITFAMGLEAFWLEPLPYGSEATPDELRWPRVTFIVDQKDVDAERRELIRFLDHIHKILIEARHRNEKTTVQFYIWNSVQFDHLKRIIGRHLSEILSDRSIAYLAWLFPPEEVLPNAVMETRRSPITVVKEVIKSILAAPIPHYYTLFTIARLYHDQRLPERLAQFNIDPLFEDQLSDQIPSERAHDIWSRSTLWAERLRSMQNTVSQQLLALQTITRRLEKDLYQSLQYTAPEIKIGPPKRATRISLDGQLWLGFTRYDAALKELEIHKIRAMPPHEREARFQSARLIRRIVGEEEAQILNQLKNKGMLKLPPSPRQRVYKMRPESKEVKFHEGDFAVALAPETDPSFLDRSLKRATLGTEIEPTDRSMWKIRMESVTSVSIVAIDRDAEIIVLNPNRLYETWLDDLEDHGIADFSHDVILDQIWINPFTKKLEKTLRKIGNPSNARNNPLVQRAIGGSLAGRGRVTYDNPAGDIVWSAKSLVESRIETDLDSIRKELELKGCKLNQSEWKAWERALTHRFELIWGPPGTGKSRTLRAVALGALLRAYYQKRMKRILICAPTYTAIDNVILKVNAKIKKILPNAFIQIVRIRSKYRAADDDSSEIDLELNLANPSEEILNLRKRLVEYNGLTLVGAPPQQVHNLLNVRNKPCMAEAFDVIILDEASQMDVGHAILPIASIAKDGALVIAGDPCQLPPIHQAKPPLGLDNMVGSVFNFFKEIHKIEPTVLETNYRSNGTIVEFAKQTGYPDSLNSYSPDLLINLVSDLPFDAQPAKWPQKHLYWTPQWSYLLNPNHAATCFIYPEGVSGQSNAFEADAVTALIYLLYGRLGRPLNENSFSRQPAMLEAYDARNFWEKGVGIVTPHRAQRALIISRLQNVFSPFHIEPSLIRGAVDTVERYQGQQRDIIIASYTLGDEDAIRDEAEFLLSLNRFNVMVSRARAKIVTFVSKEVVSHLASDMEVLRESRLLKIFTESFCNNSEKITLGYINQGNITLKSGTLKYR